MKMAEQEKGENPAAIPQACPLISTNKRLAFCVNEVCKWFDPDTGECAVYIIAKVQLAQLAPIPSQKPEETKKEPG